MLVRGVLLVGAVLVVASLVVAFLAGGVHAAPRDALVCAPGYSPCLPVRNDLDCAQITRAKKPVRVTGADGYDLDTDRDGLGCVVAGEGGGSQSPWGLILRKPPGKEARRAKVGDVLTAVGWSPSSFEGERFRICNVVKSGRSSRVTCFERVGPPSRLRGAVQTFGHLEGPAGSGRQWRVQADAQGERQGPRLRHRPSAVAAGVGFEPTGRLHAHRFSRPTRSAAPAPRRRAL